MGGGRAAHEDCLSVVTEDEARLGHDEANLLVRLRTCRATALGPWAGREALLSALIALILAALLLAAACDDGGEPVATPPPTAIPTPRPAAPTGCDPARPQAAGDFVQTIDSGGLTRRYILHIPPSYSDTGGADATPLVLLFHGHGGRARSFAGYTGLPAKADRAGFIAVMPQGLATTLTPEPHWNFTTLGPFGPDDPDDVAFIDDLLDALEAELCIDSARVFSTGFSLGAHLSVRLACDLSDRIAAIAPVAGVYFPPFKPGHIPEPACLSTRPVPVIAFHGTDDTGTTFEGSERGMNRLIPWVIALAAIGGGLVLYRGSRRGGWRAIGMSAFALAVGALLVFTLTLPVFESSGGPLSIEDEYIPGWAAHNGCASVPVEEQVTQNVRLVRYEECDDGATVELYAVDGGGHQWPDATYELPDRDFGTAIHEISANDLMWDFFAAHPLSAARE